MAFLCGSSSLLVSFLFVLLFISVSSQKPNVEAPKDVISDLCRRTRNPPLCLQVLRSDPRSANANLKGLGLISIDIAQANAEQTSDLIASLNGQTTSPVLKVRYSNCAQDYGDAIKVLDQAKQFLNSGDYKSLGNCASSASDMIDACDDSFEVPPAEPTQLRQANQKLEDICDIIFAVAVRLSQPK